MNWLLFALQMLPFLIRGAEMGIVTANSGATKKSAVLAGIAGLTNTPLTAVEPAIGPVIDASVAAFNANGGIPSLPLVIH